MMWYHCCRWQHYVDDLIMLTALNIGDQIMMSPIHRDRNSPPTSVTNINVVNRSDVLKMYLSSFLCAIILKWHVIFLSACLPKIIAAQIASLYNKLLHKSKIQHSLQTGTMPTKLHIKPFREQIFGLFRGICHVDGLEMLQSINFTYFELFRSCESRTLKIIELIKCICFS